MRRALHIISGVLFGYLIFTWIIQFLHFALGFPWNVDGIKEEMSDTAFSMGYETWEDTVRIHLKKLLNQLRLAIPDRLDFNPDVVQTLKSA